MMFVDCMLDFWDSCCSDFKEWEEACMEGKTDGHFREPDLKENIGSYVKLDGLVLAEKSRTFS